MSEPAKVQIRPNGPILVSGNFVLLDANGNPVDLGGKDTIALCRCGHTKNSPFCDGSHKQCGFQPNDFAQ